MKIRVTGGYSDYVRGELTDTLGGDLHTATLKIGLFPANADVPELASGNWQTPDVITYPHNGLAVMQLLVTDDDYQPGRYRLWALPIDNPTAVPVVANNDIVILV